jgi:hypothetical protein
MNIFRGQEFTQEQQGSIMIRPSAALAIRNTIHVLACCHETNREKKSDVLDGLGGMTMDEFFEAVRLKAARELEEIRSAAGKSKRKLQARMLVKTRTQERFQKTLF